MVVGADPAGGVHGSFKSGLHRHGLPGGDGDPAFHQVELGPPRDPDQVVARRNLLGERSVVGVVLVIAAVGR